MDPGSSRRAQKRCGPEARGLGLADWLAQVFTYADRARWEGEIAAGRLRIGPRLAQAGDRLEPGDLVSYEAPAMGEPEVDRAWRLVLETPDFLIVDKPPLLPCHPGGRFYAHSLWYMLKENYGPVGFAGRLDRETSGLVLVTRNPGAAARAQAAALGGDLKKDYLVLVHGRFPQSLEAQGWLVADGTSQVRKKRRFIASASGQAPEPSDKAETCATRFRLLRSLDRIAGAEGRPVEGEFSLLEARPGTGRLHQIRASLYSLGFPVVGDKLYGRDETIFLRFAAGTLEPEDRARLILPNQALHAHSLRLGGIEGLPDEEFSSEPPWLGSLGPGT